MLEAETRTSLVFQRKRSVFYTFSRLDANNMAMKRALKSRKAKQKLLPLLLVRVEMRESIGKAERL